MPTTLAYSAVTITLHDDLQWSDEFEWRNVEIKQTRTIAGALIVDSAAKTKGRPITLRSTDTSAWLARSVVAQLQTAADIVGQKLTLTFRGTTYTVMFAAPVGATPVLDYSDPQSTDFYSVMIPLIEVEA